MGRQFALLTSTCTFRTLTGPLCPKGIGNSGIQCWMKFETRLFATGRKIIIVKCWCWAYWPRLITLYVHSPLQSWTILTWDRNYNQCQVEHPDKQVDCFILIYVWLLIFLLLLAFFCGLDLGWILAVTCSAILKALCRLWLLIHSRSDSQWRRWRDGATSRTCFLVYVDKHYTLTKYPYDVILRALIYKYSVQSWYLVLNNLSAVVPCLCYHDSTLYL